jgi:predicted secreted protein
MVFQKTGFENEGAETAAEKHSLCSSINNLVPEVGKGSVKVRCGGEYCAKETDSKGPTLWRLVWADVRPSSRWLHG